MAVSAGEPGRSRLRFSFKTQLIGLTALVIAFVVGALTSLFSIVEIRHIREDQVSRLAAYGAMVSHQVRSAVAFDDRETASDVLAALTLDPDIRAVVLLGHRGNELFRHGTLSRPVPPIPRGAPARVYHGADYITCVREVTSLEGPDGTLIIELSTLGVQQHRRMVIVTAVIAGALALILGAAAVRWLTRSMLRRLRSIADVASAVSRDPSTQMVNDDAPDEIGTLARAFNRMLGRLRADQRKLHDTVAELTTAEDKLERANHDLEQRVEQRTRQLHAEMDQRAQMEVELRQAQKLESVGRLAAGIAHEINTPVQFVSDSCAFLEAATTDLISLIAEYRDALAALEREAAAPAPSPPDGPRDELTPSGPIGVITAAETMRRCEDERDVGYLTEHIPQAISRALQGLQRVSAIVRAMKEFAYPDRKDQAPADLNRAILSTLTVAHNEYKYVAEVRTELDDLPLVTCHVGELNQVILNMVVNSAHAIAAAKPADDRAGLIVIRTRARGERVEIEIEDNGCGIPQAAIDKIFDPFFTTKEIGKGTGQGLAIARAVVVDKHAGKIDVRSRVGQGTTFAISLPVLGRPPPPSPEAIVS